MISRTLGAPFGGAVRGGHQGTDPCVVCLITPPNFGDGFGSPAGSTVVVALGAPGLPVVCTAGRGAAPALLTSSFPGAIWFPPDRSLHDARTSADAHATSIVRLRSNAVAL